MKELFRAESIKCDYQLEDYYLSVYQGEIIYIQCVSDKSPECLCDIITGNRKPDQGRIFINEERIKDYNAAFAAGAGIYAASLKDNYEGNQTVAQALAPRKPFYALYSEKKLARRVEEAFKGKEIGLHADDFIFELNGMERKMLSLIRARALGAELIVIPVNGEVVEGKAAIALGALIRDMNREGVTFVIVSCNYSVLAEYAHRIQLLYLGRAVKEWTHGLPSAIQETVLEQLKYGSFFARQGQQGEAERNFTGLYDYEWDVQRSFWEYLRSLRENSREIWDAYLGGEVPEEGVGYYKGTAVVPGNSQDMLFPELSVGENLTIGASKRVNHDRIPFINPRIQRELERRLEEIYHETGQTPGREEDIRNLTGLQRKILSIERVAILRPKIIFLELPYYDVGYAQVGELRSYLSGLVKRKIKVVYFSKTMENMILDCKVIIHTQDGKSAKIDTL